MFACGKSVLNSKNLKAICYTGNLRHAGQSEYCVVSSPLIPVVQRLDNAIHRINYYPVFTVKLSEAYPSRLH